MPIRTTPAPTTAHSPVLRVTRYEEVSSFLFAAIGGLVLIVVLLACLWYSTRISKPREPIAVDLFEDSGGAEDGSPDETLRVDSPDPPSQDAAAGDLASDEHEVQESLDQVVALAG